MKLLGIILQRSKYRQLIEADLVDHCSSVDDSHLLNDSSA